jgi:DNA-binding NtrC family response regulator
LLRRVGYAVHIAGDGAAALAALEREHFDLVLTDLKMADPETGELSEKVGHALLVEIRRLYPGTPVVLITGNQTIHSAVEAMKAGASDYVTKPLRQKEIANKVAQALRGGMPQKDSWVMTFGRGSAIETRSPRMRELLETALRVAARDATVLISGPAGSGKEILARHLHAHSRRAGAPFLAAACGGIPESLFEDELFGHERGAFTGATRMRRGLFEQAASGTIYLDSIEETPLLLQGKLVPAIEARELRRIGGGRPIPVAARVIASTAADLRKWVEAGRFRSDLYFSLRVVQLELPALRDRMEDLANLAEEFLREAARSQRRNLRFGAGALARLEHHEYPGNLRELRNVVFAAATFASAETVDARHVDRAMARAILPPDGATTVHDVKRSAERERIRLAVRRNPNNRAAAARELGISRTTLWRKLVEMGLASPSA